MKSIGEIFKETRRAKNISQSDVARATRIKPEFVALIEESMWDKLPSYSVLSGFIKNIAGFLGLEVTKAYAIFKRDYPPRKLFINPKRDISKDFAWNPKFTFILLSGLLLASIVSYLFFQYRKSLNPPVLVVNSPQQGQVIEAGMVLVSGSVTSDATVTANNQPIIVDEGEFEDEVAVSTQTTQIVIVAKTRTGKETTITRTIEIAN